MFIGTKKSKRNFFHNDTCRYAKLISEHNAVHAKTRIEFLERGYLACPHCDKLIKESNKKASILESYEKNHGIKYNLRSEGLFILTGISVWKIMQNDRGRGFVLYHQNSIKGPFNRCEKTYWERDFHFQKVTLNYSINWFLKYIVKHDTWRESKKKEQRATMRKKKNRRNNREIVKKYHIKRESENVMFLMEELYEFE